MSAKLLVNAIINYNKSSVFSKPVKYYRYDIASDTYTLGGSLGNTAQLSVRSDRNWSVTTQASLNYGRTFAGEHHITGTGVDFSFLNRKIYGETGVFYRKRTGIPTTRQSTLPSTFGASLPQENINSLD